MNQVTSAAETAGSFLTAENWISLLSVGVAIIGIYLVVTQLKIQNSQMRLSTLQSTYLANLELQKLLLTHPELVRLYVGGTRHGYVVSVGTEKSKELAQADLILDHAEFQYLSALESRPSDAELLVASHFSNPELQHIWRSDLRGRFDPRFANAVDRYLADA